MKKCEARCKGSKEDQEKVLDSKRKRERRKIRIFRK
jgi:hypothetical protein